jgi:hypothetical protein
MVVMSTIKISLGIRYAVDNGAKVINGSFGKVFLHTSNGCMTQLSMLRKRCIDCSRCRKMMQGYRFCREFSNDSEDKTELWIT